MTEQESDHDRLIRIETALQSIKEMIESHPPIRHVNSEGVCDAYHVLVEHDRTLNRWEPDIEKIEAHETKINQWSGALAAVALLSSFIGGLIGALAVFFGFKR